MHAQDGAGAASGLPQSHAAPGLLQPLFPQLLLAILAYKAQAGILPSSFHDSPSDTACFFPQAIDGEAVADGFLQNLVDSSVLFMAPFHLAT